LYNQAKPAKIDKWSSDTKSGFDGDYHYATPAAAVFVSLCAAVFLTPTNASAGGRERPAMTTIEGRESEILEAEVVDC
jgi:hypothetical protein